MPDASPGPIVSVEKLSKTFYIHKKDPGLWGSVKSLAVRKRIPKHAVREVSFQIGEGEIVGLVGANGAGKTTLVKMLAGVIHPTSGGAQVLGFRPWERDNRLRRQIALVMGQKAQLWWDLPAGDCFLLLKEIYRIPEQVYRSTLDELSALLEVEDQLSVQVRRLSLGERMKMELIATLLHRPRVVYLDEPTIGLDLNAQRAIREFILRYQKEHAPVMIVTSHYMEDIERLCRRILIMRDGEIVYDGNLDRVVHTFAPNKIIAVHLAEGSDHGIPRDRLERLGELVECSPETIRLMVPRSEVAQAAAFLVNRLPVADLAIGEQEIGAIIANIIAGDAAGNDSLAAIKRDASHDA